METQDGVALSSPTDIPGSGYRGWHTLQGPTDWMPDLNESTRGVVVLF
jgi:hypothetical protein